jgi:hypothetical protein
MLQGTALEGDALQPSDELLADCWAHCCRLLGAAQDAAAVQEAAAQQDGEEAPTEQQTE